MRTTGWFGAGGFASAVRSLGLAHARLSQQYLWDAERHPDPTISSRDNLDIPTSLHRLVTATGMPQLSRDTWPLVYEALAAFSITQTYNLTDASRWPRDYLDEQGVHVGRNALAFVVRGLASSNARSTGSRAQRPRRSPRVPTRLARTWPRISTQLLAR